MHIDLWGNEVMNASDYADDIIQELNKAQNIAFEPNYDSKRRGVTLYPSDAKLPENAIHCIYRNNVPLYVGYSGNSTRDRLSKFCAVVRGTIRDDEGHAGGNRYLEVFGNDFEGVSVRAVEYYAGQDISVKLSDITEEIALKLNASFNDVVYKKTNSGINAEDNSIW